MPATTFGRQHAGDRLGQPLIVLAALWWAAPRTLQTFLAAKSLGNVQIGSGGFVPLASMAQKFLLWTLVGACVFTVALCWREAPRERGVAVMALMLPWLYMIARDAYLGGRPDNVAIVYPVLVLALWITRTTIADLIALGYVVTAVAVVSLLIALALPNRGLLHLTTGDLVATDKQILPGGILVGIMTNGNNIGQVLANGLPTVLLVPRPRWRWAAVAACLVALVWSASRGSIGAVVGAGLAMLIVRNVPSAWRALVAFTAMLAAVVLVVAVPLLVHQPESFSNRGYVWQQALISWHGAELFGHGARWFTQVATTSATLGGSVFHAHNQFLQLLVTGGYLYVLAAAPMIWLAVVAAARLAQRGSYVGLAYVVTLAGTCIFEVTLSIIDNGLLLPFSVIPLAVLLCAPRDGPVRPPAAATTDGDSSEEITAPAIVADRSRQRVPAVRR